VIESVQNVVEIVMIGVMFTYSLCRVLDAVVPWVRKMARGFITQIRG